MKPKRHVMIGTAFVILLAALAVGQFRLQQTAAAQAKNGVQAPRFEVDPMWPKPLPNHWLLGSTIGVSVDAQDHVWIIHRSSATLNNNERGAELDPPTGECCKGAPPVLEFDQAGNLLRHWAVRARASSGRSRTTASPSTTRATSGSAATAPTMAR